MIIILPMGASYMLSSLWINFESGSKTAWKAKACSLEGRGTMYLNVIFLGTSVNMNTKNVYGT
jgi:hypothetical protein